MKISTGSHQPCKLLYSHVATDIWSFTLALWRLTRMLPGHQMCNTARSALTRATHATCLPRIASAPSLHLWTSQRYLTWSSPAYCPIPEEVAVAQMPRLLHSFAQFEVYHTGSSLVRSAAYATKCLQTVGSGLCSAAQREILSVRYFGQFCTCKQAHANSGRTCSNYHCVSACSAV